MYFSEFISIAEGRKKDLKRMFDRGHSDIVGDGPKDPEYKARRKAAIKSIMKGLKRIKESPDNERDRLTAKRTEEGRLEREKKEAERKKRQQNDSRLGSVGVTMPYTGRLHHSKYTVDTSTPKMKEYRF